jgi:hypothetical protein
MEEKEKLASKAGTIIGIVFIAFVLFFLASMWISGATQYRSKQFCSWAESDASNILAAIADYFAVAEHTEIARSDIEKQVDSRNPWTFARCGDNFFIYVVDGSGKCSAEYQEKDPGWNAGIYTRSMF